MEHKNTFGLTYQPLNTCSSADTSQVGGLFTLFLHAPVLAFSFISGITEISPDTWEQCTGLITQAEGKIAELMGAASLGKTFCQERERRCSCLVDLFNSDCLFVSYSISN